MSELLFSKFDLRKNLLSNKPRGQICNKPKIRSILIITVVWVFKFSKVLFLETFAEKKLNHCIVLFNLEILIILPSLVVGSEKTKIPRAVL